MSYFFEKNFTNNPEDILHERFGIENGGQPSALGSIAIFIVSRSNFPPRGRRWTSYLETILIVCIPTVVQGPPANTSLWTRNSHRQRLKSCQK